MSKIEVDAIDKQSGSTVTIGGSGTNVVLGTCGQTVSLGTGATQTGFGRTGTVDWQTGSIKTGDFTAVNTQGFFKYQLNLLFPSSLSTFLKSRTSWLIIKTSSPTQLRSDEVFCFSVSRLDYDLLLIWL